MELMGNLLDNACKFAISEIRVQCPPPESGLLIVVEDDGPGIAPGKSQQIFQRGVRADSSPARDWPRRGDRKSRTATAARSADDSARRREIPHHPPLTAQGQYLASAASGAAIPVLCPVTRLTPYASTRLRTWQRG